MDTLEVKKTQRFLFMNLLYEKTDGNQDEYVNMWKLGKELKFTEDQTQVVVQYFTTLHFFRLNGDIELYRNRHLFI